MHSVANCDYFMVKPDLYLLFSWPNEQFHFHQLYELQRSKYSKVYLCKLNRVGNTEQVGIWFHPFVFLQVNVRESEVVVAEETKK